MDYVDYKIIKENRKQSREKNVLGKVLGELGVGTGVQKIKIMVYLYEVHKE